MKFSRELFYKSRLGSDTVFSVGPFESPNQKTYEGCVIIPRFELPWNWFHHIFLWYVLERDRIVFFQSYHWLQVWQRLSALTCSGLYCCISVVHPECVDDVVRSVSDLSLPPESIQIAKLYDLNTVLYFSSILSI